MEAAGSQEEKKEMEVGIRREARHPSPRRPRRVGQTGKQPDRATETGILPGSDAANLPQSEAGILPELGIANLPPSHPSWKPRLSLPNP